MKTPGRSRRRKIVVDKRYQYQAAAIGIVYITIVAVCLTVPLVNMMRSMEILLEGRSGELAELYRAQKVYTTVSLAAFFVAILGAWTAFSLWRTHRVAGPIISMTRFIHNISAGAFSERLKLRSGDELQALANALNRMAEGLRERDRSMSEAFLRMVDEARSDIQADRTPEGALRAMDILATRIGVSFEPARPEGESETAATPPETLIHN